VAVSELEIKDDKARHLRHAPRAWSSELRQASEPRRNRPYRDEPFFIPDTVDRLPAIRPCQVNHHEVPKRSIAAVAN